MVQFLIFVEIYLIEMFSAYFFFSQIGTRKFRPVYCFLIGSAVFSSALFANFFGKNIVWLNLIMYVMVNIVFGYLCFDIKLKKTIVYSLMLVAISSVYELLVEFSIALLTNVQIQAYLHNNLLFFFNATISKILYFFSAIILSQFIVKEKKYRIPISLYIHPFSIIIVLTVVWYVCRSGVSFTSQIALTTVGVMLLFSTIILFLTYQKSIEKENELLQLKNEMSKIETEMTYYDILERQNQDLMIYAHDTKNHLSAIKNLNNNPQINEYIDKMTESLESYKNVSHSGNHILDVIISKYVTECKIKDIKFSYDVRLKNLDYVEDFDLVTILGNLLDNALESAINSYNREISLSIDYRNTYDVLVITNSCDIAPQTSNNRLVSTKNNKSLHGIGLKSVKRILKKYKGDYEWEYDKSNKIFTSIIMLTSK